MSDNSLKYVNNIFKSGDYSLAIAKYQQLLDDCPHLRHIIIPNITMAKSKLDTAYLCGDFFNLLEFRQNTTPHGLFKDFDVSLQQRFIDAYQKSTSLATRVAQVSVSVIMPTYNRIKTVASAIQSVLDQTHGNFELLVVDDGSTDGTVDFLNDDVIDTRVRVIEGTHNGVSAARNLGLQNSNGEYLFYLDSDNRWDPKYLELMLASFVATGCEAGYAGIKLIDENNKLIGYRGESFNWTACLTRNYVDLNPFAHSRRLLDAHGGFDENLKRMVDWDLILRYTKNNPPFYAPFIGCIYIDTKTDAGRVTVKEPVSYRRVVQAKNKISEHSPEAIARAVRLNIAIKIPAPYEKRMEWGDFHYAESLKTSLEKLGHNVTIDFHKKWYERNNLIDDVVIVLRGLTEYQPQPGPLNIMWNISHPDQIDYCEYSKYDLVYVASDSYKNFLNLFLSARIKTLMQCTDQNRFYFDPENVVSSNKALFIGNSRNEYRTIVKRCIEGNCDIDLFGGLWEQFVDRSYIRSGNLPNSQLRQYYGGYKAVLNDHWSSMKEYGFISNRVFDVLAAGGNLISDAVPSLKNYFDSHIVIDDGVQDFSSLLECRTQDERQHASKYVTRYHTFDRRAEAILNDIFSLLNLPRIYSEPDIKASVSGAPLTKKTIGLLVQYSRYKTITSSAYIRLFAPLTHEVLRSKYNTILLDGVNSDKLKLCDYVIVQRTAVESMEDAHKLLRNLERHQTPLLIDTDDSFSNLPDSHPDRSYYASRAKVLNHLSQNARFVVCSTPILAMMFSNTRKNVKVIANCLDARYWINYRKKPRQLSASNRKSIKLLYMGTPTHDNDFQLIFPTLDKLYKDGFNFSLTFIGVIRKKIDRPWINYIAAPADRKLYPYFVKWFSSLEEDFDLGLIPLQNNEFNYCKSDIKALDYAGVGIPSLCSHIEPYQSLIAKDVVFSAENSANAWYDQFKKLFNNPALLEEKQQKAINYLWNERSTEKSALEWKNILSECRTRAIRK